MTGVSRRRHLVLRTAGFATLFVLVAAAAVAIATRPEPTYRPGEAVQGLTADLARGLPPDYPRITFSDATAQAGIHFRHFNGDRTSQLPEDMGSGAAWGDYDGDGWLDLYVVNEVGSLTDSAPQQAERSPAHAALYRNLGDGTLRDVAAQAGVRFRGWGMGATWADYDNDGRLDLFVTAYGDNVLYRNNGDGTFADRTRAAGVGGRPGFWTGARWHDYDRDGFLDLYVTGYVKYRQLAAGARSLQYDVEQPASINPSSFEPERNLLFHNNGNGTFTEVATRAGVANPTGRSLSATWADFDEDGWPDLYVANDVSDNVMYRNLGDGTFADVSHAARVADYRGAMGLAVGDWDGDQDLDLFVTHWLAQENALYSNLLAELKAAGANPHAPLQFADEADRFGVGQIALDFVGWGTSFFDYDNDARLDLFVVNGSTLERKDDPRRLVPMRNQLFWNRGANDGYYDVSPVSGPHFAETHVGRGAAFADYDNDGDVDVFVVTNGGPGILLRNDGGNRQRWLTVELEGTASNRQGVGSRLRLVAGGTVQIREVGAQASYLSHNDLREHFGLGTLAEADTLEIRWPSGTRQIVLHPAANQVLHVTETAERRGPSDASADERERVRRFWQLYRQATDLRIAGRTADAAEAYSRALALNAEHQDALYYQGSVEFDLGHLGEAERAWRRLVAVDPSNARGHSQLGVLYSCVGQPGLLHLDSAIAEFTRAHEINREESGPLLHLGEIALLQGDLAQARSLFDKVAASNVSGVEAPFYLGYLTWKAGAPDRAAQLLAVAAARAQPTRQVRAVPGEGDTRAGTGPMVTSTVRCRPMRPVLGDFAKLDSAAAAGRAAPIYRGLDALLEGARGTLRR